MPSCPECDAEIEVDALDEFDVDLEPVELAPESADDGHDGHDDSHDEAPDAPSVGDDDDDGDSDDDDDWVG